jgi:hypothetical protein
MIFSFSAYWIKLAILNDILYIVSIFINHINCK